MPISKKEEDRIKDLTAQIQKMKDVLDSMNVKQSIPIVTGKQIGRAHV